MNHKVLHWINVFATLVAINANAHQLERTVDALLKRILANATLIVLVDVHQERNANVTQKAIDVPQKEIMSAHQKEY